MDKFSISQLQQFSGIKAHTIRIWEQRYNALTPARSEGNTRYYDNSQFRRLLNIVSLMNTKYRLSELCAMPDEKLFMLLQERLKDFSNSDNQNEYFVSQLVTAGLTYDEIYFDKIFSNVLLRMGMKNTYTNVIYPLLNRLGLMWTSDLLPPTHEHFLSNLIRQKLSSAIDSLPPPIKEEKWLLFLPGGELHEIGLLFGNYLLKQTGRKTIYLGADVPFETLTKAVEDTRPHNLLFFLVHHDDYSNVQLYLDDLNKIFKNRKFFMSGNEKLIEKLKLNNKTTWLKSVEQFIELLNTEK